MVDLDSPAAVVEKPVKQISLLPVESAADERQAWLWLLLIVHLGTGITFTVWSAAEGTIPFVFEYLLVIPALGVILAQTSLLGFWVAFSPAAWPYRLVGLILGSSYLESMLRLGAQDSDFDLLATLAVCGIAVVCGMIRWFFADLRHVEQAAALAGKEGLQFSVRGLMLFTLVVATAIVGVRQLRENAPSGPNLFLIAIWSLCFVVTGLAGVWAGLGLARPMLRSGVVLLIAAVLGALFVYGIDQGDVDTYFYIVSIMLLQASVLIASLLVVRGCGYRLVRKSASETATAS